MSDKKEKREPTLGIALACLIIMWILWGVGYGVDHIRAQVVLLGVALITGCLYFYRKLTNKDSFAILYFSFYDNIVFCYYCQNI